MDEKAVLESQADQTRRGEAMGKALGITLEEARRIIAAATKKANEINVMMNIAVVDAGGNLVAFERMDGGWIGSIDIAQKKAFTARAFDLDTKSLGENSQSGQQFFGIHASNNGKIMIFAGGIRKMWFIPQRLLKPVRCIAFNVRPEGPYPSGRSHQAKSPVGALCFSVAERVAPRSIGLYRPRKKPFFGRSGLKPGPTQQRLFPQPI
jgi:uncharacterized protein GlcG (DUF336 family)